MDPCLDSCTSPPRDRCPRRYAVHCRCIVKVSISPIYIFITISSQTFIGLMAHSWDHIRAFDLHDDSCKKRALRWGVVRQTRAIFVIDDCSINGPSPRVPFPSMCTDLSFPRYIRTSPSRIFCVATRGFPFWFWFRFALISHHSPCLSPPVTAPVMHGGTPYISVSPTTNVASTMRACPFFLRIDRPMRPHGYVHPHIRSPELQWASF